VKSRFLIGDLRLRGYRLRVAGCALRGAGIKWHKALGTGHKAKTDSIEHSAKGIAEDILGKWETGRR
jgi:hypothetical protein